MIQQAIPQSSLRSSTLNRVNEKYKVTKGLQGITKDAKIVVTRIEWPGIYR